MKQALAVASAVVLLLSAPPTDALGQDGDFYRYVPLTAYLAELAQSSSGLTTTVDLGDSWEKVSGGGTSDRDILAVRIGKKPENAILIIGGQHGNELLGVEACRLSAKWLTTSYATDDYLKYLMDNAQVTVVPMVNPDGNEWGWETQGHLSDMRWRKNRRINADGTVGVDLNRNYAHSMWGQDVAPGNQDTSRIPEDSTYCGQSPASEPEVQAIQGAMGSNTKVLLDMHAYGEIVAFPWGYTTSATMPDKDTLAELAVGMKGRMNQKFNKNSWVAAQSSKEPPLYPTTGDSLDYAYDAKSILPFVFELRPKLGPFHTSADEILPAAQEAFEGVKHLIEWTIGPPIVKKVVLSQDLDGDGVFSDIVYEAEWQPSGSSRQLQIVRSAAVSRAGIVRVRIQYSKPMSDSQDTPDAPQVSFGPAAPYEDISCTAVDGWTKTTYRNDTWEGECSIPLGLRTLEGVNTLTIQSSDKAQLGADLLRSS